MRKILVLVPFEMDEQSLSNRRMQSASVKMAPDVTFDYRAVRAGPTTYDTYHDWLLAEVAMLEAGMSAEEEGYSGVCIDTMSDSGMSALRSVLDIPVIGAGLPSYLTALAVGRNFSVLTQWEAWIPLYERGLREYGLDHKCVSMRSIGVRPDLKNLLGGKLEAVLPRLVEEGRRCIEDGADVIVLGSTTMHQAHPGLASSLPVPVVNPGPTSYKVIESLIDLGLSQSRTAYAKAAEPKTDMIRAMQEGAARAEERSRRKVA